MQKNENKLMAENTSKEISHHADELESAVHKTAHVPAWVIAKLERSSTDLSDVTHFLDGGEKYAHGGGIANLDKIKNNIGETLYRFIGGLNEPQLRRMLSDLKTEIKYELDTQGKTARYSRLMDEKTLILYRLGEDEVPAMAQGGGVEVEYVIWGTKIGDADWQEQVLLVSHEPVDLEKIKAIALSKGYNRVRLMTNKLDKPNFVGAIKRENGGNVGMQVELSAKTNNDFGYGNEGFGSKIKAHKVPVSSFAEASKVVRQFIDENDLGSGNWTGGAIYKNGKKVGRVSYNGRIWDNSTEENEIHFEDGGSIEDEKYELADKLEQAVVSYIADKKGISEQEAIDIVNDQNGREYFIDTISFTKDVKSKWNKVVENLGDEFISINDDEDFSYAKGGNIFDFDYSKLVGKRLMYGFDSREGTEKWFRTIAKADVTPANFRYRSLNITNDNDYTEIIKEEDIKSFLKGDWVELRDSQGEYYVIKLMDKVKFADGGGVGKDKEIQVSVYKNGKFSGTKKVMFMDAVESKTLDPMSREWNGYYTIRQEDKDKVFVPKETGEDAEGYLVYTEIWGLPAYTNDWFEKGGSVDDIDMNEVEKSAIFYTDETRWSTKPTIEKFQKELAEYKNQLLKLERKEITPAKIVGGGYKSSAIARKVATKWLKEKILIQERAIEILKAKGQSFEKGGGVGSIYVHKHIPTLTLEVLEYTNSGVKGLQKDSKSLSKKERKEGKIVFYKTAELNDLFSKSKGENEEFATGGTTPKQQKKIGKVMHEFKEGDLKTSAGTKVTNPKQAVAIALSEAGVPKKGWGHKKGFRK